MAGVDPTGFITKTRDEIVADINKRMQQAFGSLFDVSPESPDGQLIGIMADLMATQWEMGEATYNSYNPGMVEGTGLDNLVFLNGIKRIANRPTTVAVDLTGTAGTVVPAGSLVATTDGIEFALDAEVILPAAATAVALQLGELVIGAGEVVVIVEPLTGWDAVNNVAPGVTGINRENDIDLRARRERSVIRTGTNTAEAIYSAVADLDLEFIAIIENDTLVEVDGVPAKSFLTVVEGGTDLEIAERIHQNKPTGIQAFGAVTVPILDSQGYSHNIGLTRPSSLPIYVDVSVTVPSGESLEGPTLVQTAVIDHINNLQISQDVIWANLFAPATGVDGIIVNSITIGVDGSVYDVLNIPVAITEKAFADITTVVVTEV